MSASDWNLERDETPLFAAEAARISGGLFTAEIERVLSTGATVRVELAPLEGERVRVLRYERRAAESTSWQRVESEEGAVLAWAQINAGASFAAVFPAGGAPVEERKPARRSRRRR